MAGLGTDEQSVAVRGKGLSGRGSPRCTGMEVGTLPALRSPLGLNHDSFLKHHVCTKPLGTLCKTAISTNK